MEITAYLDPIFIPLSLFLTIGYHVYLWQVFKHNPSATTFGVNCLQRKAWLRDIKEGDDKKGMLAVQSLRNTLMMTILSATIAILVAIALGALINNAYKARDLLTNPIFGSKTEQMSTLKYGSVALFLLLSFMCSSMGLNYLVDANFLINVNACRESSESLDAGHTQRVFERGFLLALVGNRTLCITFTLLLWTFSPLAVALSSAGLLWVLCGSDFAGRLIRCDHRKVELVC